MEVEREERELEEKGSFLMEETCTRGLQRRRRANEKKKGSEPPSPISHLMNYTTPRGN